MAPQSTVAVWDPLVRLFHWSLVLAFLVAYSTGDEWLGLHVPAGYLIGGLIASRVVWGFVGPRHARFRDFVRSPAEIRSYLGELVALRAPRYLGHNPAGGLMVLALITSLAVATASGLALYGSAEGTGPLADFVPHGELWAEGLEAIHEVAANFTVLLVVLHAAGVLLSSLLHGENLVRAMVTGRKPKELS